MYAKYAAIFEYFDALLLGLTATPKDEVDRNTYRLFNLEDGVPTDAYGLDDGVADGWLVPPRGISVGTSILRRGVKYAELSEEEKDRWDALDWGEDGPPSEVSAGDINRTLFNADTVDKVLETLMRDGIGYPVAISWVKPSSLPLIANMPTSLPTGSILPIQNTMVNSRR